MRKTNRAMPISALVVGLVGFSTLAAAADLLPALTGPVQAQLLEALAKSLANSQTSGELGVQADRALKAAGIAQKRDRG